MVVDSLLNFSCVNFYFLLKFKV